MKTKLLFTAGLGAAFAAGVAFGPIGTAGAGHTTKVLSADLDGRNEVGAGATNNRIVGDPNGTAEVYMFGIDGDPTTLCYVLTVDGIETATAAHIHKGGPGTNGPVVANLAAPGDGDAADCLTQGEVGPATTPKFPTGEPVQQILANPGDYYVNVHNADFPGGALRGQLSTDD
ncbi:MAG: CHRD domain-containing protein [Acidimicrobiales bacterium]